MTETHKDAAVFLVGLVLVATGVTAQFGWTFGAIFAGAMMSGMAIIKMRRS